jgi:phage baseplate assembly protein gpV
MLDIKFGSVEEINAKEHKIKLKEIDSNIVGPWFSLLCIAAGSGRSYNLPAIGEPVACLMLGNYLGIVLGSYWTNGVFESGDANVYYMIRVDDNNVIKYNTNTKEFNIKTSGPIILESDDVRLGQNPTSQAMKFDPFSTFHTLLEAWIKTGIAPSGGGVVTYAGAYPDISGIEATQVKVK